MKTTAFNNLLAAGLFLGGVSLAGWSAYSMVDRYRPHWLGGDKAPTIQVADSQYHSRPTTYSASTIVSAHLFGHSEQRDSKKVEQAPQTKLRLNLVGVMASNDVQFARALIRVESKKMRTYAIGDQIEGTDAQLHKVENQRVILDRAGTYESLAMARKGVALN